MCQNFIYSTVTSYSHRYIKKRNNRFFKYMTNIYFCVVNRTYYIYIYNSEKEYK